MELLQVQLHCCVSHPAHPLDAGSSPGRQHLLSSQAAISLQHRLLRGTGAPASPESKAGLECCQVPQVQLRHGIIHVGKDL